MRTNPAASSSKEASARSDLRRAVHEFRKTNHRVTHARRVNESNAHRVLRTCKEIAPDVIGGLILFPLAIAIFVALAVLVQIAGGPTP